MIADLALFSWGDWLAGISIAAPLFFVGVASPGPGTLAIMNTSMRLGRGQGVSLAMGICSGSLLWGVVAASGLGAVMNSQPGLASALRIGGGLYFLWLAFKLLKASWTGIPKTAAVAPTVKTYIKQYGSGLLLHIFNPKAMFVWLAIISVALAQMSTPNSVTALGVTFVCWSVSFCVFLGYALVFSTERALVIYRRLARWIDGVCGLLFVFAALWLFTQ